MFIATATNRMLSQFGRAEFNIACNHSSASPPVRTAMGMETVASYKHRTREEVHNVGPSSANTTDGSRWIVQVRPTKQSPKEVYALANANRCFHSRSFASA